MVEEIPTTIQEEPLLIKQTREAAERLEKANKETAELIKKQEQLMARQILSGKSEAGIAPKEVTQADKDQEVIKKAFSAAGLNPFN